MTFTPETFDHFAPEVRADPLGAQRFLREQCPFHHRDYDAQLPHPELGKAGFFTVSRHADVTEILRDAKLWSMRWGPGPDYVARAGEGVLLNADPPRHTSQRRLVQKAFTPRIVAEMEPRVQEVCDELIDAFVDRGGPARGTADLVAEFAYPLPVIVIAEMLGVPPRDRATFKRWSDEITASIGGGDEAVHAAGLKARGEFAEYFGAELVRREAMLAAGEALPDDLVSGMVSAEVDGEKLTRIEQLGMLIQFLVAGNETTTSMISNIVYRLCTMPEARAAFDAAFAAGSEGLAEAVVEESLRYDAPVQGLFRTNSEPTAVCGHRVPSDSKVYVLFASANHDDAVWEDADTFRLDRDPVKARQHYGFGFGAHFCLGAPLARLEGKIAVRTLFSRLPGLRLAGEPALVDPMIFRGFKQLPVAWG